jgi:cysteine desulfurase
LATHQIAGFGAAAALARAEWRAEAQRLAALRDLLWQRLQGLGAVLRNGAATGGLPGLLNVSIEGVEGESLIAAIEPLVACSTGSACSSASREPSYVLRALGRSPQLAESSLRLSVGRFTTVAEVDAAAAGIEAAVRRLRALAPPELR